MARGERGLYRVCWMARGERGSELHRVCWMARGERGEWVTQGVLDG